MFLKKNAQVSVEYIMIITIGMMIMIPGIYLFRNYAFDSNDRILSSRISEIANNILTNSEKIYYYGPPSKTTVSIDMPPGISSMYVLSIPENDEYYLGFKILTTSGEKDYFFESKMPIEPEEKELCTNMPEQCNGNICECFKERYYSKGIKNFKTESSDVCSDASVCVYIGESS